MQSKTISKAILPALALISFGISQTVYAKTSIAQNTTLTQEVTAFRNQGLKGLEAFLKIHAQELKNPSLQMRTALDTLCGQRDCYASQLYWYTDLEQAKTAAKASGKPILSLRLLGKLDQDLSCANSRFFRVALYPNAAISKELRDKYILHWQTVRPAPKITIDFGDGRKLERTITGNSIHYILDAAGRPIDAIPGLYAPKAFLRQLQLSQIAVRELNQRTGTEWETYLRKYHSSRIQAIQSQWTGDLNKLGIRMNTRLGNTSNTNPSPSAIVAGNVAVSKSRVEMPIVSRIETAVPGNGNTIPEIADSAIWNRIAQLYRADAKLDKNSLALIQAKKFYSTNNSANSLQRLTNNFESAMALDTVRNEYILHSQIHQWFVQGSDTKSVDKLNEKVYSQLFLTPNSDPWLGLLPSDTYSAIDNDGVRK